MSSSETDPVALLRGWGQLAKEVSPEVSPIVLLIRDAAAHDAEMAALLDEVDHQRRIACAKTPNAWTHTAGSRPGWAWIWPRMCCGPTPPTNSTNYSS